ncbi:hypothetical protein K1T71_009959 [Dendrolimus kikuchii]|uniref:Uncharacterized protein n=1 Tax=Dendrolimus kikuchii TaxID=765133 RepID=A0ACC1CTD2_9NEOP|nr:hypothetical protein K1T71_009959 [Dendrolimus kikuchii]
MCTGSTKTGYSHHRFYIGVFIVYRYLRTRADDGMFWEHNTPFAITYLSTEHPTVTYVDNKIASNVSFTATRYARKNPVYYLGLSFNLLVPVGNNISMDFYFYEFLSNVYKRSFVEMHYKLCDLITKDIFFGAALRQNPKFAKGCPLLPNNYNMVNMSIPPTSIPSSFPFRNRRIALNITRFKRLIAAEHIDMEIKKFRKKRHYYIC